MSDVHSPIRPFYLTLPSVCPYLADRVEQRVVAELRPSADERMFDELSEVGFRRSQGWMYRPACPGCQACIPVRIPVADFNWTRAWRKIVNRNADLTFEELPARFHAEHYDLFRRYIASRHGDGGMAKMTDADYREMVDTGIERTMLVSFRDARGVLKAVSLTDRLRSGLSGVYKFFDPDDERRSLGSYVILWHVHRCLELDLAHVYLGYWIEECRKMAYKSRFQPLERLGREGWVRFEPNPSSG